MRYFLFLISFFLVNLYFSQIPTTCFEITSILVDGCAGSEEGQNEMVGLRIGPNPINVNDLRIDGAGANGVININKWPNTNNLFRGFCTTADATANLQILNDAIVQCGELLEPPGGILPAGANVIIITSTDFTPITTYFANLTETLYVVFQCSGNTAGHFVNFNGSFEDRTLVVHHIPSGCQDQVIYNRGLLTNPEGDGNGTDGDAVAFDFDNNPTYFNNGCQAPFIPAEVFVIGENSITNGPSACVGGSINLTGIITGDFTSFSWSGGTGTFSNPNSLITSYELGAGDIGTVTINLNVVAACNPNIVSSFEFTVDQPFLNPISNSPNGIISLCDGASQVVNASGGSGIYSWSTGETGSSITISQAGTYTITSENACESATHSFEVVTGNSPVLTSSIIPITCVGDCNASATINTTGGGNYSFLWSGNANNATTSSISNLCAGTYSCEVTDGQCSNSIDVLILSPTPISLTHQENDVTCPNTCDGSIILNGTGGTGPYSFNLDGGLFASTNIFSNLCSGSYVVRAKDDLACESLVDVTIVINEENPIVYSKSPDQLLCFNEEQNIGINITAGNPAILWSTNQTSDSILVQGNTTENYIFTLTEGPCVVTDTIKITSISCEFGISFPNIFTPNNDLTNDFYVPISFAGVKNVNFSILNRWGEMMYETNGQDILWDGKVNGTEANEGVYFYKIIYFVGNLTEENVMHGFLHLERKK